MNRQTSAATSGRSGFTLIELLVVVAIIAVLAVLVAPALSRSLRTGQGLTCRNNLRQLAIANHAYAADHGTFVAAASDIWSSNRKRWHGERVSGDQAFDPALSPLVPYLGREGRVKRCPLFRPEADGFESGCGGYGYNVRGVGSQAYLVGSHAGSEAGMAPAAIQNPSRTVMFADAAFIQSQRDGTHIIEYSFAESYFHVSDSRPVESYPAMPSIHFRHDGRASVVWVDGHVSSEKVETEYSPEFTGAGFGWFGPADNSLFDPY